MTVIGIDLGGTKLAAAVFDDDGEVLAWDTVALDGRGGDDVAMLLSSGCARFASRRAVGDGGG